MYYQFTLHHVRLSLLLLSLCLRSWVEVARTDLRPGRASVVPRHVGEGGSAPEGGSALYDVF